jgi:hypothetical protein
MVKPDGRNAIINGYPMIRTNEAPFMFAAKIRAGEVFSIEEGKLKLRWGENESKGAVVTPNPARNLLTVSRFTWKGAGLLDLDSRGKAVSSKQFKKLYREIMTVIASLKIEPVASILGCANNPKKFLDRAILCVKELAYFIRHLHEREDDREIDFGEWSKRVFGVGGCCICKTDLIAEIPMTDERVRVAIVNGDIEDPDYILDVPRTPTHYVVYSSAIQHHDTTTEKLASLCEEVALANDGFAKIWHTGPAIFHQQNCGQHKHALIYPGKLRLALHLPQRRRLTRYTLDVSTATIEYLSQLLGRIHSIVRSHHQDTPVCYPARMHIEPHLREAVVAELITLNCDERVKSTVRTLIALDIVSAWAGTLPGPVLDAMSSAIPFYEQNARDHLWRWLPTIAIATVYGCPLGILVLTRMLSINDCREVSFTADWASIPRYNEVMQLTDVPIPTRFIEVRAAMDPKEVGRILPSFYDNYERAMLTLYSKREPNRTFSRHWWESSVMGDYFLLM